MDLDIPAVRATFRLIITNSLGSQTRPGQTCKQAISEKCSVESKANHVSYSTSEEIHQYFKNVTEKYKLAKYVKLDHMVTGAIWDEDEGRWNIQGKNLRNGTSWNDWCHVLINGSGILK